MLAECLAQCPACRSCIGSYFPLTEWDLKQETLWQQFPQTLKTLCHMSEGCGHLVVYIFQQMFWPLQGARSCSKNNSQWDEGALGRGRVWTDLPWWESQGRNAEQVDMALSRGRGRSRGRSRARGTVGLVRVGLWPLPSVGSAATGQGAVTSWRPEEGTNMRVSFWPKGVPIGCQCLGVGTLYRPAAQGQWDEEESRLPAHHEWWEVRALSPAWQSGPWGQTQAPVFPHLGARGGAPSHPQTLEGPLAWNPPELPPPTGPGDRERECVRARGMPPKGCFPFQ